MGGQYSGEIVRFGLQPELAGEFLDFGCTCCNSKLVYAERFIRACTKLENQICLWWKLLYHVKAHLGILCAPHHYLFPSDIWWLDHSEASEKSFVSIPWMSFHEHIEMKTKTEEEQKKSRASLSSLFLHRLAIVQEVNDWILIFMAKHVSINICEWATIMKLFCCLWFFARPLPGRLFLSWELAINILYTKINLR